MTAVVLTQLSISMEDARVTRWVVADGDSVIAGQVIVEVETDKATIEIEAPVQGVVRIVAAEEEIVVVDGVLAEIEPAEGVVAADPVAATPVAPLISPVAAQPTAAGDAPGRRGPIASPAARRLARESGIDLAGLEGSGPGGRIVARDIAAAPLSSPAGNLDSDRLRQAVVANVTASWQQIPHVHIGGELKADGLRQAREALATSHPSVTVTDLLIVALGRALAEVPSLNGWRQGDGAVQRSAAVHLALAVATEQGVLAPVLRDIDSRSLAEIAEDRRHVVEQARAGTLDGRRLAGGTCTLSNLGAFPVDFFAPVISGPQIAMVATGRIADRVVAENGLVGARPRMWVNVAIDHRAADGEAGGRLLAALERQIATLTERLP